VYVRAMKKTNVEVPEKYKKRPPEMTREREREGF
jgi:hypothetical protein